jgi:hypothetical protein
VSEPTFYADGAGTVRTLFLSNLFRALDGGMTHAGIKHAWAETGLAPFAPATVLSKWPDECPPWARLTIQRARDPRSIGCMVLTDRV